MWIFHLKNRNWENCFVELFKICSPSLSELCSELTPTEKRLSINPILKDVKNNPPAADHLSTLALCVVGYICRMSQFWVPIGIKMIKINIKNIFLIYFHPSLKGYSALGNVIDTNLKTCIMIFAPGHKTCHICQFWELLDHLFHSNHEMFVGFKVVTSQGFIQLLKNHKRPG